VDVGVFSGVGEGRLGDGAGWVGEDRLSLGREVASAALRVDEDVHAARNTTSRPPILTVVAMFGKIHFIPGFMERLMDSPQDRSNVFRRISTATPHHSGSHGCHFFGKFAHLAGQDIINGFPILHARQSGIGLDP
jgi:hypothetical protein